MQPSELLLLLAFLSPWLVSGQVYSIGHCPRPAVKPYFDVSQYTGRWYEIQRFLFVLETGLKCNVADYSLTKNGDFEVENKAIDVVFGTTVALSGIGHAPDPEEPAELAISFTPGIQLPLVNYKVLDTDYHTYAVVYHCNNLLVSRLEFAWILSRTNTLPSIVISRIYRKLVKMGIDPKHFRKTDHSRCFEPKEHKHQGNEDNYLR